MKKRYLLLLLFLFIIQIKAQEKKVGIQTDTPTEIFDVKGTLRLRSHPLNDAENSIYTQTDGTSSLTQNQPFRASKLVVSDINNVLGAIPDGLPVTSVTKTFIAPSGGFSTGTNANPTYVVSIGFLEIGLYQTSNNNNFWFAIRSTAPGTDNYTVDLREFGGTFHDWRFTGTLASGTWSAPIGYLVIGIDTWLVNINFRSLNRIYRATLLGAKWSGSGSGTTAAGDQFTVNIQQLSGIRILP